MLKPLLNQDFHPKGNKSGADMIVLFKITKRIFKIGIFKNPSDPIILFGNRYQSLKTGYILLALTIYFFQIKREYKKDLHIFCYF